MRAGRGMVVATAVLLGTSACEGVLALDRFAPAPSEGGGGSASVTGPGGSDGTGGADEGPGGAGAATDWRDDFPILYGFEDAEPIADLGTAVGNPSARLALIPEGSVSPDQVVSNPAESFEWVHDDSRSLRVPFGSALRADSTTKDFDVEGEGSFSLGGWVRIDPEGKDVGDYRYDAVMGHYANAADQGGFVLQRQETPDTRRLRCILRDDQDAMAVAVSDDQTWRDDRWVHVACVYDHGARQLQAYVDGEVSGEAVDVPFDVVDPTTRRFQVGGPITGPSDGLAGDIDELFFRKSALSAPQVARIYSCGVDGRHCLCDPAAPAQYESCGFWSATMCDAPELPPCNATFVELALP